MKMKKFWARGGGAHPSCPPLDPPLVSSDGAVLRIINIVATTACDVDMKHWPNDEQTCVVKVLILHSNRLGQSLMSQTLLRICTLWTNPLISDELTHTIAIATNMVDFTQIKTNYFD